MGLKIENFTADFERRARTVLRINGSDVAAPEDAQRSDVKKSMRATKSRCFVAHYF